MERLTLAQMSEKYPNQYLGITNIKYNGATIEEADVIYMDKSDTELLRMQLLGDEGIEMWCTASPSAYIGHASLQLYTSKTTSVNGLPKSSALPPS